MSESSIIDDSGTFVVLKGDVVRRRFAGGCWAADEDSTLGDICVVDDNDKRYGFLSQLFS